MRDSSVTKHGAGSCKCSSSALQVYQIRPSTSEAIIQLTFGEGAVCRVCDIAVFQHPPNLFQRKTIYLFIITAKHRKWKPTQSRSSNSGEWLHTWKKTRSLTFSPDLCTLYTNCTFQSKSVHLKVCWFSRDLIDLRVYFPCSSNHTFYFTTLFIRNKELPHPDTFKTLMMWQRGSRLRCSVPGIGPCMPGPSLIGGACRGLCGRCHPCRTQGPAGCHSRRGGPHTRTGDRGSLRHRSGRRDALEHTLTHGHQALGTAGHKQDNESINHLLLFKDVFKDLVSASLDRCVYGRIITQED